MGLIRPIKVLSSVTGLEPAIFGSGNRSIRPHAPIHLKEIYFFKISIIATNFEIIKGYDLLKRIKTQTRSMVKY